MARELPIHNGRMTTDLDANGFKIKNLPPGSGFTQAQADWNQADATAPDFIKNKPTIPVVPTLATVATSGSYNDLSNKPTIPAAVTVVPPSTSATTGQAADAKATGDALAQKRGLGDLAVYAPSAFSGWTSATEGVVFGDWFATGDPDLYMISFTANSASAYGYTSLPPTGTSETSETLAAGDWWYNDGGSAGDFPVTFTRTVTAWTPASPADSLAKTSQIPDTTLTPVYEGGSEWTFSGLPSGVTVVSWTFSSGDWVLVLSNGDHAEVSGASSDTSLRITSSDWMDGSHSEDVIATRHDIIGYTLGSQTTKPLQPQGDYITAEALPYPFHPVTLTSSAATLQDRAVNTLTVAADCTLTLPAVNANGARDLLLRLGVSYVSGTTLPQITINLPTGETGCAFETDGDSFPVPAAEGAWCYSFTETAQHKFAVSLKSLTTVVQTALGGS